MKMNVWNFDYPFNDPFPFLGLIGSEWIGLEVLDVFEGLFPLFRRRGSTIGGGGRNRHSEKRARNENCA
jgi:hypothetical protein